jgi:hypothetical protein
MRYRVGSRVYADFDRAAGAALMESLERHATVDIAMLTEKKVELHVISVSAHNIQPAARRLRVVSGELQS